MATIKHLSSKNSNYAAAESYLTFQHNEYTGLPILDEKGRPKLRDSYLLDTLECGESSFAMACLIANRKYGKNGRREDVKTHHYIISFDPKDAVENGLTMERAQALAHAGTRHRREGEPRPVELLPARPDKVHHRQETEQKAGKGTGADRPLPEHPACRHHPAQQREEAG